MERFWKTANVIIGVFLFMTACAGHRGDAPSRGRSRISLLERSGRGDETALEHYVAAELAYEAGDYPTARAEMEAVLDVVGADPFVTLRLADFYIAAGEADRGERLIVSVLDNDPANPEAHLALSRKHRVFGETAMALAEAREAVARDPAYLEGGMWLSKLLAESGRLEEAALALAVTARHHPRSGRVAIARGDIYLKLNEYVAAKQVIEVARRLGEVPADAWVALARGARRAGRLDDGAEYFERAFALSPPGPALRLELVDLYLTAGRPVDAKRHLFTLDCDLPATAPAASALARRWVAAKEPFVAREVLVSALSTHSGDPALTLHLAAVEIRLARLETAALLLSEDLAGATPEAAACRETLTSAMAGWPDIMPICPLFDGAFAERENR